MPPEMPGLILDKKTLDNKIFVQETSRPMNTTTYFTSQGDDISGPTKIGGGQMMSITHNIGDSITQNIYIDWNIKENKTYIHEGYVMWKDASFDTLSLSIVPTITTYIAGTNTNYNLYGGYLIIPAAGNGTITPVDVHLIEMPISRDRGTRAVAYWDADYSTTTHTFSNIRANPTGLGQYMMFAAEVTLSKFVNKWILLNSGFIMLQTSDSEEMGCGMRLKFSLNTEGTDHNWQAACGITMHREKNC